MDANDSRQDVLDAIERYYAVAEDPSAGHDDEHDAAVAVAAEFNNLDEAMQSGERLPEVWRAGRTVEPDDALRSGLAERFAAEPSQTRYIVQYARLEWLVEEAHRSWAAGDDTGSAVAFAQCLAVIGAARDASEAVLSRLRETVDDAAVDDRKKGLFGGECATPGCVRPSRWISIHEATLDESFRMYRCAECCDQIHEAAAQLERKS